MSKLRHPLTSLNQGHWFKLICGASYQHLPNVRNLTLAYALAGADCVDVAADSAIIAAAREAFSVAHYLTRTSSDLSGQGFVKPWLMVSLNDGEDPHFRKAEFDPNQCPADCPRPCEAICPAQAIVLEPLADGFSGVLQALCYGCGRCLPICPTQQISTRSYVSTPAAIAPLILEGVDAIEIHTQVGRQADFQRLWQAIKPQIADLKAISISCPDGEELIDYLWSLYEIIGPLSAALLWQTDGRPMSGDIGDGTTRAAIKLSQKVLAADLPGYVQLAGGTNRYTVNKLTVLGLLKPLGKGQTHIGGAAQRQTVAGVAYGSYARTLLTPLLEQLELNSISDAHPTLNDRSNPTDEQSNPPRNSPLLVNHTPSPLTRLEDAPDLLFQAVRLAQSLVFQLKGPNHGRVEINRPIYSSAKPIGIPLQN